MKTTLNFPDTLITQAKIRAAMEHTTLTGLIVEGLELRMRQSSIIRELPVSRAEGGLLPGNRWETISREGDGNEVFR